MCGRLVESMAIDENMPAADALSTVWVDQVAPFQRA